MEPVRVLEQTADSLSRVEEFEELSLFKPAIFSRIKHDEQIKFSVGRTVMIDPRLPRRPWLDSGSLILFSVSQLVGDI